jgi:hypothetical protein
VPDKKIINGGLSGTLVPKGVISGTLNSKERLTGTPTIPMGGGGTVNYENLRNKPRINDVQLIGNKTASDLYLVSENTTSGWNETPQYLPKQGEICIYTDAVVVVDDMGKTVTYPDIKIGDGNAYLINMPFVSAGVRYAILDALGDHIRNTVVHITQEEREFWNNKLNYDMDGEQLILSRD